MPDKIIRLGGSSIIRSRSVQNLKSYIDPDYRNIIVFSAVPEIYSLIESQLQHVFASQPHINGFENSLNRIWISVNGREVSDGYSLLVRQLLNILSGIALIGDYSAALKDHVLSFSEKLTAEILKHQWGSPLQVLEPEVLNLLVSDDYGNATFVSVDTEKLTGLGAGVWLIPGSFGVTRLKKIARAGRAAADYTAAFLARSINAEAVELWGLDHDFLRTDPSIVSNPPKIERLTYSEASELAYFDHYSFHPRTVEPLEMCHIPVHVLNVETANVDTVINTETYVEEQIVKGVASSDDISLLKLDGPGVGLKPGILARVTSRLNDAGINIKSVITSQTSINLILDKSSGNMALDLISQLGFNSVREISIVSDVALIGIVGHGMRHNYGVSARIFNAVAQHRINVLLSGSGASDLVSYLVVHKSDKEKSVREIYKAFFNDIQ